MDITELASKADDELAQKWTYWSGQIEQYNGPNDRQASFRTSLLRCAYSYARMGVLSFGFLYALRMKEVGKSANFLERVSAEFSPSTE